MSDVFRGYRNVAVNCFYKTFHHRCLAGSYTHEVYIQGPTLEVLTKLFRALLVNKLIKRQSCHHTETSQLIC